MSKDTIYFNHDYNARNDPKMVNLRMKYGWEGYGIFWALMEIMREESAKLSLSDCNAFAFQLHMQTDKMQEYIHYFLELKLLTKEGDFIYSKRMMADYKHMKEKSKKAKASAQARWNSGRNANALQTQSEGNAKEESIGENSREEESKEETTPPFHPSDFSNSPDLKPYTSTEPPAAFDNPFQRQKKIHLDCVRLLESEHDNLVGKYGKAQTEWMIERLNNHKMGKGDHWYESDYHKILGWVVDAAKKEFKAKPQELRTGPKSKTIKEQMREQEAKV